MSQVQTKVDRSMQLFAMGLILVALGAILQSFNRHYGSWTMIVGGFSIAIAMLMRTGQIKQASARIKRLDRMSLLGGLSYIVAGGFGLEGSTMWIIIFAVGTVFTAYSIFVRKEGADSKS